jgi:aminomuconate-semialdehyde/2-hydroxymuconate-6-semialdehyde dehydrogenase
MSHESLLARLGIDRPGHFIDGSYVPSQSGKTFINTCPATGEALYEIPAGDETDMRAAIDAAEAARRGPWQSWTVRQRSDALKNIAALIEKNRTLLATLEALDTGKPLSEAFDGDIARSASNFQFFAELILSDPVSAAFTSPDGSQHRTVARPIGTVGLITPWNLPLYLASWKLAPALAQGNTVVLKPAELTPLTAMAMGRIFNEAGLPKGVVNIVQGFGAGSAGEALVRDPRVKAISFTGETLTGEAIMRTAAPHLKKLSFELGGKGASVIFADADIKRAAETAARAAFRNQGQICLAGSRLIVEKKAAPQVLDHIIAAVQQIKVGHPLAAGTTMGSLISGEHRAKVAGFVDYARTLSGCEILCGGKAPAGLPDGAYFEPTVITGVPQESRLIQEEIFGPVLTIQTFETYDEAIALLNGTQYGLSCSVWTGSDATAERAAADADTGLVWLNSWFLRNLHTAFGGMKRSGIGREGGRYSLEFYSELKSISRPAHT